ncbi:MAG: class II fumarate hydratase, partial [bacterium]
MEYRIEKDTMGEVKVPIGAYYGAQTQRSIDNFKIAQDINRMPKEIIRAFAYLKKAAALTNKEAGVLTAAKASLIGRVCD